jgi:hypothetical protein
MRPWRFFAKNEQASKSEITKQGTPDIGSILHAGNLLPTVFGCILLQRHILQRGKLPHGPQAM